MVFVLLVAAIRELLEDLGRLKADKAANTQKYDFIREGKKHVQPSAQLYQGDIVILKCGEEVPADSLLLYSSNDSGIAYVNTAQLDGESNLKPKV